MVALAKNPNAKKSESKTPYCYGNYLDEVWTIDDRTGAISVADLNDGTGSERHFYHCNTLYHVYANTDETGALAEAVQAYDAYGKVSNLITGAGTDTVWFTADDVLAANPNVSAIGNPWFYTGQRLDAETGLMYYKNRYYSVDLGRFVSRDPIGYEGGSLSHYQYVKSNSIQYVDPEGLRLVLKSLLGPWKGPCGGFRWEAEYIVGRKHRGGVITQYHDYEYWNVTDCDNIPIPKPAEYPFYESFLLAPRQRSIVDAWSDPDKKDTKGRFTASAQIRWFPNIGKPGDMTPNPPRGHARGSDVYFSDTKPVHWEKGNSAENKRELTMEWNCCDERKCRILHFSGEENYDERYQYEGYPEDFKKWWRRGFRPPRPR